MHVLRRNFLRNSFLALTLAGSLALLGCASGPTPYSGDAGWVGTWGASPVGDTSVNYNNQTLRLITHVTLGGEQVRIRLSNSFGNQPLEVGAAQVGLRASGAGVVPGSHRKLSFGGSPSIVIPPGAVVVSDAVALSVGQGADLAVSLYLPKNTGPVTQHFLASQTSYVSGLGNSADSDDGAPFATKLTSWPFLSGVEVLAGSGARAVVTFGDSITDGFKSTVDTNGRWPDQLARRLQASGKKIAVVNHGISGNRLWWDAPAAVPRFGANGLARFERDVLAVTGASHVVVLLTINDIGQPGARKAPEQEVSANQIIVGLRQLIARAHARGLRVIGGTLTPFDTYNGAPGYYTAENEAKRQAVNAWIRSSKEFDGVIDFDAATRDPANPSKFLPAYDSGDRLHPNDAGYKAMGDAVNLSLFD
ncbi:MAG: SGNH/GDSL hydrolase family protein [Cytophagales bacterium]|nr:SGNH/GDSL hydrolase family protein [Rhizobacter sp.]